LGKQGECLMSPITLISYTNIELSAARALNLTLDPTKKGM